jgi:hypothetical protein
VSAETLRAAVRRIHLDLAFGQPGGDEAFLAIVADWLAYVADTHDETACPAMVAAEQVATAYLDDRPKARAEELRMRLESLHQFADALAQMSQNLRAALTATEDGHRP